MNLSVTNGPIIALNLTILTTLEQKKSSRSWILIKISKFALH